MKGYDPEDSLEDKLAAAIKCDLRELELASRLNTSGGILEVDPTALTTNSVGLEPAVYIEEVIKQWIRELKSMPKYRVKFLPPIFPATMLQANEAILMDADNAKF